MFALYGNRTRDLLRSRRVFPLLCQISRPYAITNKGSFSIMNEFQLVCTTEQCVAVWSLLSLSVKWLVQLNPTCLAADPFSNKMAITTSNNDSKLSSISFNKGPYCLLFNIHMLELAIINSGLFMVFN
jgi:hypothetical protein